MGLRDLTLSCLHHPLCEKLGVPLVMRPSSTLPYRGGQVGTTNTQSKWEPGSPCMVCHSQNTLGSSGLSSTSSPHSARGPVRPKHHAHSHSCRGPPPGPTHNVAVGGATRDQTNGESSQVAEVFT